MSTVIKILTCGAGKTFTGKIYIFENKSKKTWTTISEYKINILDYSPCTWQLSPILQPNDTISISSRGRRHLPMSQHGINSCFPLINQTSSQLIRLRAFRIPSTPHLRQRSLMISPCRNHVPTTATKVINQCSIKLHTTTSAWKAKQKYVLVSDLHQT